MKLNFKEIDQHWQGIMNGVASHRKNVIAVTGQELIVSKAKIARKLKIAESEIILVWRFKKAAPNCYSCYLKTGPPMLINIHDRSKPMLDQIEVAQCLPRIKEILDEYGMERKCEVNVIIARCRVLALQMFLAKLDDQAEWIRLMNLYGELHNEALSKPENKIFGSCVAGVNYVLQACLKLADYN